MSKESTFITFLIPTVLKSLSCSLVLGLRQLKIRQLGCDLLVASASFKLAEETSNTWFLEKDFSQEAVNMSFQITIK